MFGKSLSKTFPYYPDEHRTYLQPGEEYLQA